MNLYYLIRYVPMWVLTLLAQFFAFFYSLFNTKMRRSIATNLALVYPELSQTQRVNMTRQVIISQAKTGFESLKSWAMSPEWNVKQITQVHNQEALQQALDNPNGMLAIVPHLGTWEIMNAWLNQFGSPTIMYKPVRDKQMNDFILAGRQRLNATLVPTDASGVKAILKTLKSGGFSILLPDHIPDPSGGEIVPFYGIPSLTSTLASKLAIKTHCSLVGLTCVRSANGKGFEIYCDKLDNPALFDKNVLIATSAMNIAIEKMIDRFPSQYMWNYQRFRPIPNFSNIYKSDIAIVEQVRQVYPKHLNHAIISPPKITE